MNSPRWTQLLFLSVVFAARPLLAEELRVPLSDESVRAAATRIDELIAKSCKDHEVPLNAAISDDVFVRRIYLDLAGRVPTVAETRAFLGNTYPAKRERLIDALLGSEGYVSHAYNYWADVLRVNDSLGNNGKSNEAAYRLWIKDALRQNKTYDRMAYQLVSAKGHIWENGAIGYYQRDRGMPLDNMANTVRIFLGTRLECAQCHDHPFDKWKQMDFFEMAAFSNGMDGNRYDSPNRRALTETGKKERGKTRDEKTVEIYRQLKEKYGDDRQALRAAAKTELAKLRKSGEIEGKKKGGDESLKLVLNELYKPLRYTTVASAEKALKLPHDYQYPDAKPGEVVTAGTMFGAPAMIEDGGTKIESYAKWLTSPENPTFTKVIVNRLWKRLFGLALIEPFDDLTDQSVAVNPELLAYLEGLMVELNFDMRGFTRILANTESYQRAATNAELELGMPYYFQGPVLRRLSAEQVWDSALTLLVEDPDRYKPSVKKDIATIEEQKQIYESLEGIPFADYREMIGEVSTSIGELSKLVEQKRKEAVIARGAGEEEKARELSAELRVAQKSLDKTMRETAFAYIDPGADEAELMKRFGLTETVLEASVLEEAKLETPKEPLPEGLSKQERRAMMKSRMEEKSKGSEKTKKKGKGARGEAGPGEPGILARASEITAGPGSFLRTFGQSDREVIENASEEATVPQALELLNGPVFTAISNPESVLGKELQASSSPEGRIETIYTALLSRKPTSKEAARLLKEVTTNGDQAYDDIIWAVLNSSQFQFIQ